MQKRYLFPLSCAVLAAVLFALLLIRNRDTKEPPAVQTTRPGVTAALPTETRADGPSGPEPTIPTEPEQTEPEQAEPVSTEPAWTEPERTEPTEPEPVWTEPEETEPPVYDTVPFPVELEGGMLTVQSIFTYSGMNPDADWTFGENIAGVQVTNTSEKYLRSAEITAVLADGNALTFRLEDVPAGRTAMAFSMDQELTADPESCEDLYGEAEFSEEDPLPGELVQVQISGTEITLRNVSGRDLNHLNVICHGLLDDSCFGGIAYHYTVASLSAGGTAVVHAQDCLLGMAEVVRVELSEP